MQHFACLMRTAGEFVRRAREAIDDILSRGKVPVVVGGTMMYVQWLVHGTPDAPKKARATGVISSIHYFYFVLFLFICRT